MSSRDRDSATPPIGPSVIGNRVFETRDVGLIPTGPAIKEVVMHSFENSQALYVVKRGNQIHTGYYSRVTLKLYLRPWAVSVCNALNERAKRQAKSDEFEPWEIVPVVLSLVDYTKVEDRAHSLDLSFDEFLEETYILCREAWDTQAENDLPGELPHENMLEALYQNDYTPFAAFSEWKAS